MLSLIPFRGVKINDNPSGLSYFSRKERLIVMQYTLSLIRTPEMWLLATLKSPKLCFIEKNQMRPPQLYCMDSSAVYAVVLEDSSVCCGPRGQLCMLWS